jgi:hypothetical protein
VGKKEKNKKNYQRGKAHTPTHIQTQKHEKTHCQQTKKVNKKE